MSVVTWIGTRNLRAASYLLALDDSVWDHDRQRRGGAKVTSMSSFTWFTNVGADRVEVDLDELLHADLDELLHGMEAASQLR
eukprot:COSAG01_NODE_14856_length_1402_cov_34.277053_2_plen_82_part_00